MSMLRLVETGGNINGVCEPMGLSVTEAPPRIPIWRTAATAYRQGIGALILDRALFRYFVYSSLAGFAVFAVRIYLVAIFPWYSLPMPAGTVEIAISALTLLVYVALTFAVSPYGVAVHRKLLLGESPHGSYLRALGRRREKQFFLVSVAVMVIAFVTLLAPLATTLFLYGARSIDFIARAENAKAALVISLVALLACMTACLATARCAFAFPAIAVDQPGASVRQSLAETRGTTWRLFFLFVLIYVPPLVIYVAASDIAFFSVLQAHAGTPPAGMYFSSPFIFVYVLMVIVMMLMVSVTAAATSRAYEIRVDRGASGIADVFS